MKKGGKLVCCGHHKYMWITKYACYFGWKGSVDWLEESYLCSFRYLVRHPNRASESLELYYKASSSKADEYVPILIHKLHYWGKSTSGTVTWSSSFNKFNVSSSVQETKPWPTADSLQFSCCGILQFLSISMHLWKWIHTKFLHAK